MTYRRAP